MIAFEQLVGAEHIAFMEGQGFTLTRVTEYRPRFSKVVQEKPAICLVVERQQFGSGWRAGVLRRWREGLEWRTLWVAGHTPGVELHKPGGSLIFEDPTTAFIHAQVEEWGGKIGAALTAAEMREQFKATFSG